MVQDECSGHSLTSTPSIGQGQKDLVQVLFVPVIGEGELQTVKFWILNPKGRIRDV
jgi:hypothetical protein